MVSSYQSQSAINIQIQNIFGVPLYLHVAVSFLFLCVVLGTLGLPDILFLFYGFQHILGHFGRRKLP